MKNKATSDFFLNAHGDYPETRSVIEKGLEWQYENKNYKDTIQTNGPLKNDVVIMVRTILVFNFQGDLQNITENGITHLLLQWTVLHAYPKDLHWLQWIISHGYYRHANVLHQIP